MPRAALVVFVSALFLDPGLTARDQQTTFRATTRLIVQAVAVTDARGRPIAGLTASDFEVTENGQAQTIAFVEFQRLDPDAERARLPAVTDGAGVASVIRPGIAVPQPGDARYRDRRLLVFYFDLSTMSPADNRRAFSGAIAYVERGLAPADVVAIVTFDGGAVRVRQDFTDDRDRLVERLRLLADGGDTNGDGVDDEAGAGSAFGEGDAEFNMFSSDRQLAALHRAVDQVAGIPEQKALMYFGSGLRLTGVDNQAQVRATANAAVRANVTINPIDARGLVAFAPMGDATRASAGGTGLFSGALTDRAINRVQRSQDTLYALAKDTGGVPLFDRNDLLAGIVQAADAVTSYYLIGYYSPASSDDGRFRRVRVAIRGRPDARLAYRDGYTAAKVFRAFSEADRERQLEEALRLDDPVTDVAMAVELNVFRLNRSEYYVPVSLKIPGREIALARRRGGARTRLDVIGEVKDDHGVTHRNLRDELDIRLDNDAEASWEARPLQYETGFTLLPGGYVLKMLVRDGTTGRIGTYETSFRVENAERQKDVVPMSSVVLSSQQVAGDGALYSVRRGAATVAVNPLFVDGHQWLPSVTRVFGVTRDLHVFMQVYRTATFAPAPVVAYVGLYLDGIKVRESDPIVVSPDATGARDVIPIALTLPLAGLEPGTYECQVSVLGVGGGKASFWRATVVLVR